MKIQVISDVHANFHADGGLSFLESIKSSADVLVIAGDVGLLLANCPMDGITFLNTAAKHYSHIVIVFGNHDYYHTDIRYLDDNKRKLFNSLTSNVHILDNSFIVIDDQRFIGATSWFEEVPETQFLKSQMNDFLVVKNFEPWVFCEALKTRQYFGSNIQEGDIVISHHLPHTICVPEEYKDNLLNCFYVHQMKEEVIERSKLWIFGHTHNSRDILAGNSRLLSNPFGYCGSTINPEFKENLIIEV